MKSAVFAAATALILVAAASAVAAGGAAQQPVLGAYESAAKAADPAFAGFSAARGGAFFAATSATAKGDTKSCTACHTASPKQLGKTRAGKDIAPMAVSVTPDRFTDAAKVEKWFARNCDSVLSRACTPVEKGDFIAFMISQ